MYFVYKKEKLYNNNINYLPIYKKKGSKQFIFGFIPQQLIKFVNLFQKSTKKGHPHMALGITVSLYL